MASGILDAIDGALADYDTSADAMRWSPRTVFPRLTSGQMDVVRRLAADTGIDGYAALLVVADVEPFLSALRRVGEALGRLSGVAGSAAVRFADFAVVVDAKMSRRGSGPLAVNGREYHRRQRARQRRKRGR